MSITNTYREFLGIRAKEKRSSPGSFWSALLKFWKDPGGTVAITGGLSITVLFGFTALAVDVASWQVAKRSMQGAADAAAYSAGVASIKNNGIGITTQAKGVAAAQGYVDGQNGVTVTVNRPPTSGSHTSDASAIQVIIQQAQPMFFAGLFLPGRTTAVQAGAVVTNSGGSGCILALSTSANQAIDVSGSGSINAPNCDVTSNSTSSTAINMSGSAAITAACLVAAGDVHTTGGLTETKCATPKVHAAAAVDPYASVPEPTPSGSCLTVPGGNNITLNPGNYCSGLSVSGTVTFSSGLYYINGNFSIQGGATATGSGVTFYVTGGHNTAISGGSSVNFTAPTTGTYAGIAYFGDRTTTNGNNNFSGGSAVSITGAIYYATQKVSYTGGTNTGNGCTQLIASTITISGPSNFDTSGCSGKGVSTISVADGTTSGIHLVE
jgi:hypothetical protein